MFPTATGVGPAQIPDPSDVLTSRLKRTIQKHPFDSPTRFGGVGRISLKFEIEEVGLCGLTPVGLSSFGQFADDNSPGRCAPLVYLNPKCRSDP